MDFSGSKDDRLIMKNKMLIIMPSLDPGGAEKFTLDLILDFKDSLDIDLVLISRPGEWFKKLPSSVKVKVFNTRLLFALPKLFWLIKNSEHNLIFGSGYHNKLMALLAVLVGKGHRTVVRETSFHVDKKGKPQELFINRFIFRNVYPFLKSVIFQSHASREYFQSFIHTKLANGQVLHNTVDLPEQKKDQIHTKRLIFVGRFDDVKNIPFLLKTLSNVKNDFRLDLYGKGPMENEITELIKEYRLERKVNLKGFELDREIIYKEAGALLICSKTENFPNVVLEASAYSVPVIALNCPGGLQEIFDVATIGWLAPSGEDFKQKIESFLSGNLTPIPGDIFFRSTHYFSEICLTKKHTLFERLLNE
jgi:glycosyltransferase involved in cell wall biosynthesis